LHVDSQDGKKARVDANGANGHARVSPIDVQSPAGPRDGSRDAASSWDVADADRLRAAAATPVSVAPPAAWRPARKTAKTFNDAVHGRIELPGAAVAIMVLTLVHPWHLHTHTHTHSHTLTHTHTYTHTHTNTKCTLTAHALPHTGPFRTRPSSNVCANSNSLGWSTTCTPTLATTASNTPSEWHTWQEDRWRCSALNYRKVRTTPLMSSRFCTCAGVMCDDCIVEAGHRSTDPWRVNTRVKADLAIHHADSKRKHMHI